MSIVRKQKKPGTIQKAFFGDRKQITKEDRQEAARFADISLLGYQLPTRKHILPFANALSRNKFVGDIEIRDSCLCAASLETLAASIADAKALTSVNLAANTIDRGLKSGTGKHGITEFAQDVSGVRALIEVVGVQKLMSYLNLSKNGLDWQTAEILSEHLCDHPSLVDLDLSINFIGSKGAVYLSKLIKANKVLRKLNLRSNNIGSLGLDLVCRSLRVNRALTHLDLRNNNLDDDSIRTLTDTIRVGARSLVRLDLAYNKIGPKGATALSFGLKSPHMGLRELILDYNPLTANGQDLSGIAAMGTFVVVLFCLCYTGVIQVQPHPTQSEEEFGPTFFLSFFLSFFLHSIQRQTKPGHNRNANAPRSFPPQTNHTTLKTQQQQRKVDLRSACICVGVGEHRKAAPAAPAAATTTTATATTAKVKCFPASKQANVHKEIFDVVVVVRIRDHPGADDLLVRLVGHVDDLFLVLAKSRAGSKVHFFLLDQDIVEGVAHPSELVLRNDHGLVQRLA